MIIFKGNNDTPGRVEFSFRQLRAGAPIDGSDCESFPIAPYAEELAGDAGGLSVSERSAENDLLSAGWRIDLQWCVARPF